VYEYVYVVYTLHVSVGGSVICYTYTTCTCFQCRPDYQDGFLLSVPTNSLPYHVKVNPLHLAYHSPAWEVHIQHLHTVTLSQHPSALDKM